MSGLQTNAFSFAGVLLLALLAQTPDPAAAAAAVPGARPASGETPLTLLAAGEHALAYRIPAGLCEQIARGDADTLPLPAPVLSRRLNASGVTLLPLRDRAGSFLVGARDGVLRFDLESPQAEPARLLAGADVLALQEDSAGTCYALLRTWTSDVGATQPYPAPILSFRPEGASPPETVAVAHPGAAGLFLAAGDSLMWIPRLFGRTFDRLHREGGRWTLTEVLVPEGQTRRPDRLWVLRLLAVPPAGDPYLFEQTRGAHPDLLALRSDGTVSPLYTWHRAFQAMGISLAGAGDLLLVNGVAQQSLLRISSGDETYLPVESPCTAAALSPDGRWIARAEVPVSRPERTRIEIARVGAAYVAVDWVEGAVGALSLLSGGDSR